MAYDILIIGAGPVGLSFAGLMAETDLKIALIERSPLSVLEDPAYDGREVALTHASYHLMNKLGMWDKIPEDNRSMIKTAKVLNGNSHYALSFDHEEAGEETLGYLASNNKIRKAAYDVVKNCKNVEVLTEKEVKDIGTDDDKGWVVLADGTRLEASVIVAADSRFSATRRMMGISTSMLDFGRTCIVSKMKIDKHHDDTAYECFHYGRTLAVLPLKNDEVSIVITMPAEDDEKVLKVDAEELNKDIKERVEGHFGNMTLSEKLYPYPLVATFAKRFNGKRFALLGDAAVGMHPVTAHGFNLGLKGAHTLSEEMKLALQTGGDFACDSVLEKYSRKHRMTCTPLYHGTNAIVTLFTKETPLAKVARKAMLRLGNFVKPAKKLIMNQLTESREI